jgi:hypothetical protein
MKTRTIALSTMLAALLALAGCAQGTVPPARAANAPYPMIGFASPGADGQTQAAQPLRFEEEEDRMVQKPIVMTDKWAR